MSPRLSPQSKKAVLEFAERIATAETADAIQNAAFESIKKNGLKPSEFFPLVYSILLASERGPRLGPYIADLGPAEASRMLVRQIQK